eukprot:TRINITY_DN10243_c0_g1_i4.p1 TRINITY_DN10243_c0_g1~~TRINITY_DN10243_c0_g1_i4.p1  ORF type:complete len:544 (-),score=110.40 TRINITY_DN10243_c0_g1_i4:269-1900(-)
MNEAALIASVEAVNSLEQDHKDLDETNGLASDLEFGCDGRTVMLAVTETCAALLKKMLAHRKHALAGVHVQTLLIGQSESTEVDDSVNSELLEIVIGSNSNDIHWLFLGLNLKQCHYPVFDKVFAINTTLVELSLVCTSQEMVDAIAKIMLSNKTLVTITVEFQEEPQSLEPITSALEVNNTLEKLSIASWHSCKEFLSALKVNRSIRKFKMPMEERTFCGKDEEALLLGEMLQSNPVLEVFLAPLRISATEIGLSLARSCWESNIKIFDAVMFDLDGEETSIFFEKPPRELQSVKLGKESADLDSLESLATASAALRLEYLNVSYCELGSEKAAELIAEVVRSSSCLKDLSVNGNPFTSAGFAIILDSFKRHPSLTWLTLGNKKNREDDLDFFANVLDSPEIQFGSLTLTGKIQNLDRLSLIVQTSLTSNKYLLIVCFGLQSKVTEKLETELLELVKNNQSLCVVTEAGGNFPQGEMAEHITKNKEFISGKIKMMLAYFLLKHSQNSSAMADLVNLPELIWKFAAGWVFVFHRSDVDTFLDL